MSSITTVTNCYEYKEDWTPKYGWKCITERQKT